MDGVAAVVAGVSAGMIGALMGLFTGGGMMVALVAAAGAAAAAPVAPATAAARGSLELVSGRNGRFGGWIGGVGGIGVVEVDFGGCLGAEAGGGCCGGVGGPRHLRPALPAVRRAPPTPSPVSLRPPLPPALPPPLVPLVALEYCQRRPKLLACCHASRACCARRSWVRRPLSVSPRMCIIWAELSDAVPCMMGGPCSTEDVAPCLNAQ